MPTATTLPKITSQPGISIAEAARRVSDLGWTPTYVQQKLKYPTDYKISRAPKDPMKQVLRSYFPMQAEKDNRVYGALDAGLRGNMFRDVQPRWIEWMKLFLGIIPFPEISAARSMAIEARLAPGDDLKTGFTMQMIDELRHSTIQMNLKKWLEQYFAGNLLFEPLVTELVRSGLVMQFAAAHGDFVTPAIVAIAEGDYERNLANTVELFHILLHDPKEAEHNRQIVEDWLDKHVPVCRDAANQLQPIWSQPRVKVTSFADCYTAAKNRIETALSQIGVNLPKGVQL